MKAINLSFLTLLLLVLFTSCKDNYSMLTVINRDGSAHREISFLTDSATMLNEAHPSQTISKILDDPRWKKTWKRESSKEDSTLHKVRCIASQDYSSVEEMAKHFPIQCEGKPILKSCKIQSHFKWLYTDYEYEEVYNDYSDIFEIPLSQYLDPKAASYWLTGQPNLLEGMSGAEAQDYLDSMATQYDHWISANIIYDAIDVVISEYDSLKTVPISKEQLISQRDSLIDYMLQNGFSISDDSKFGTMAANFFGFDYFKTLFSVDGLVSQRIAQKYASITDSLYWIDIDYHLMMPGAKVIDCGNGICEKEGYLTFRITGNRLLSKDYTVKAVFRAPNYWAYVVSAIIIVVPFILSFVLKKRKMAKA